MIRSWKALLAFALIGCGPSESEPSGSGGTAGVTQTTGGTGGVSGASGGTGGAGGAGTGSNAGASGSVAETDLFTDPSVPDCLDSGPSWELIGTIGSQQIMLTDALGIASNIASGKLSVLGLEPGGGITIGDTYDPLILTWDGSVMERGTSRPLTGERFLMPGGDPAMPSGYCIVSGDIGPTTLSPNVLFKFRVTAVQTYENGVCTGAEQTASLAGCMLRTNEYLP